MGEKTQAVDVPCKVISVKEYDSDPLTGALRFSVLCTRFRGTWVYRFFTSSPPAKGSYLLLCGERQGLNEKLTKEVARMAMAPPAQRHMWLYDLVAGATWTVVEPGHEKYSYFRPKG